MSRPSISRALRALADAGLRATQITIHSDGSFRILTDAAPAPLDASPPEDDLDAELKAWTDAKTRKFA